MVHIGANFLYSTQAVDATPPPLPRHPTPPCLIVIVLCVFLFLWLSLSPHAHSRSALECQLSPCTVICLGPSKAQKRGRGPPPCRSQDPGPPRSNWPGPTTNDQGAARCMNMARDNCQQTARQATTTLNRLTRRHGPMGRERLQRRGVHVDVTVARACHIPWGLKLRLRLAAAFAAAAGRGGAAAAMEGL